MLGAPRPPKDLDDDLAWAEYGRKWTRYNFRWYLFCTAMCFVIPAQLAILAYVVFS